MNQVRFKRMIEMENRNHNLKNYQIKKNIWLFIAVKFIHSILLGYFNFNSRKNMQTNFLTLYSHI